MDDALINVGSQLLVCPGGFGYYDGRRDWVLVAPGKSEYVINTTVNIPHPAQGTGQVWIKNCNWLTLVFSSVWDILVLCVGLCQEIHLYPEHMLGRDKWNSLIRKIVYTSNSTPSGLLSASFTKCDGYLWYILNFVTRYINILGISAGWIFHIHASLPSSLPTCCQNVLLYFVGALLEGLPHLWPLSAAYMLSERSDLILSGQYWKNRYLPYVIFTCYQRVILISKLL